MRNTPTRTGAVFGLMVLLLVLGSLMASTLQHSRTSLSIGDFSRADPAAAKAAFEGSRTDRDLVTLIKILCYRWKVQGDEATRPDLARYGTLLLDRARAGESDLEKADDPDVMLQVLALIREAGAR